MVLQDKGTELGLLVVLSATRAETGCRNVLQHEPIGALRLGAE